jgi:hypothetical protein
MIEEKTESKALVPQISITESTPKVENRLPNEATKLDVKEEILLAPDDAKTDAASVISTSSAVSSTPVLMKLSIEQCSKIPAHDKGGIFLFL